MSTSQFIVYTSSDSGGPGPLTGQAGSLLSLLDACLVNGYTAHAAAGWTKPFANSGNIGCYKQGAGALMSLLINDNGPNGTSTFKEAWAVGWESIASIAGPVGTGGGQFPTPAQLLTSGHVVWRKSATADATGRTWQLFADSSTFYLFVQTGDNAGVYYAVMFGDMFSMTGVSDAYRCMIVGRAAENTTGSGALGAGAAPFGNDQFDGSAIWGSASDIAAVTVPCCGHFAPRTYAGTGTSITLGKNFDYSKGYVNSQSQTYFFIWFRGGVQAPNGPDNSMYLSPVWISETSAGCIRGRWRGIVVPLHLPNSFADGQTFAGAGDYAGKTYQIIKLTVAQGALAIETSATVETNS